VRVAARILQIRPRPLGVPHKRLPKPLQAKKPQAMLAVRVTGRGALQGPQGVLAALNWRSGSRRAQEGLQKVHRQGAAEEVALVVLTACAGQQIALLGRFHPFGDHF
jgi:hypothetical protein